MNTAPKVAVEHSFMNEFQMALIHESNVWTEQLFPALPGSTILGKADQSLIRIFNLVNKSYTELLRLQSLVEKQDNATARRKSIGKAMAAKTRATAIRSIAYIELGQRFPQIWENDNDIIIYLCEDWDVAMTTVNEHNVSTITAGGVLFPPVS